ncbi:hypothetical protein GALL_231790 [mine drainage metagenome]|uniref:Uncharacterized protein n=1 Tax=mine drainage metagenome TaxID=410659 RepID=A0A1J5RFD6_9ZZZZ
MGWTLRSSASSCAECGPSCANSARRSRNCEPCPAITPGLSFLELALRPATLIGAIVVHQQTTPEETQLAIEQTWADYGADRTTALVIVLSYYRSREGA